MAGAPKGKLLFSKLDIKDGYWRMNVEQGGEWNFAYVLPPYDESTDIELVIPCALQMGWCESPAFFCAATETARDVAVTKIAKHQGTLPPHPLEKWMLPVGKWKKDDLPLLKQKMKHMLEVYIDDFCTMVQTDDLEELRHVTRALLHAIHEVFPPPHVTGHKGGDSISIKKLLEGEGVWDTRKQMLGWIFDGITRCIELPEKKVDNICSLIHLSLRRKGIKFKEFEQLVGKMRHAAMGIPGSLGLFTPINQLLSKPQRWICFKKHHEVRDMLEDFRTLLREATKEPIHCRELVPALPDYLGHCDACKSGAGGEWHSGTLSLEPIVWRVEWPKDVQELMVSEDNPTGTITNSDLECAGLLLHVMVLEAIVDLFHKHIGAYCDNTPTVAWAARLASKRSRIAGRLLRALALRLRVCRASPLLTISIAGVKNDMADISSRSFGGKAQWNFACDDKFLLHFNTRFPLPQNASWRMFRPTSEMSMRVISALLDKKSSQGWWTRLPKNAGSIGTIGRNTRVQWESIQHCTSLPHRMKQKSKCSQLSLAGSGEALSASNALSAFKPFKSRFAPLERRSVWHTDTTQCTEVTKNT